MNPISCDIADAQYHFSFSDALLVLEDGQVYVGKPFGAQGSTFGEIVFSTGMTGYQETITDPSYDKQIVVQTFPHIGNTGVNAEDPESSHIWVAGYVVRNPSPVVSNWRADDSLQAQLEHENIVGISDIDTRKLVRHLRSRGVMRAGIFSADALKDPDTGYAHPISFFVEQVRQCKPMIGQSLYEEVSTKNSYTIEPLVKNDDMTATVTQATVTHKSSDSSTLPLSDQAKVYTVVAFDLGIKSMTPYRLAERGCRVHVVPADTTYEELKQYHPDGVFFSNGPGDPEKAEDMVELLRAVLRDHLPFFGICFGHQLLGRALGFGTYKLKFGHRGVNQPIQDVCTHKVEITAHNHGFAVDAPIGKTVCAPFNNGEFGDVYVSHVDLNDNVVEGLQCVDIPAFSVQYHPEAASGPHDASYLFDRFVEMMRKYFLDSQEEKTHA